MSDPTKAELAGELTEKLSKMQDQASEARGAAKAIVWILSVSGPLLIIAIAGLFGFVMDTRTTLSSTSATMAATNGHAVAELARLDKSVKESEDRLNQRLKEALGNRFEQRVANVGFYHEHVGKIGRISRDSITLVDTYNLIKVETTIPISPGARILVKGEGAKLEDLKPGMYVRVWHDDGNKAQLIEAVEEPAPPPVIK